MTRHLNLRRVLLGIIPAALALKLLPAQQPDLPELPPRDRQNEPRLPNGKSQREAILKADYEQNLKDAQTLASRAHDFQLDLEKSDRNVLSLPLLKELDEIEKIARRIRGRMRRI